MTDTIKLRLTGEREDIKTMITALDPVLDIVTDWRIFLQRTGTRVSAYLEARPPAAGRSMPRLMSVALTEPQVRLCTKTITRRVAWRMLNLGGRVTLCRKVQGRKPGEPLECIVDVEIVSIRRERLDAITATDVAAERFPDWAPTEFVEFFCRAHRGIRPDSEITRIQWRYLDSNPLTRAKEQADR